jgi:hypothetical protein
MRRVKICLLLLAAFIGGVPHARADTQLSQNAAQYVRAFWAAWSGPAALTYMEFAVTDPVQFYGKSISRDDYTKLQTGFAKRWPERHYTLVPGTEQITCKAAALACDVSGTVSWRNFDPARKITSTGTAKFDFSLQGTADQKGNITSFSITAMTGADISHQLAAPPPDAAEVTAPAPAGNFAPPASGQNAIVSDAALQAAGCVSADDEELLHQGCNSLAEQDLTKAFHTPGRIVLEITQAKTDDSAGDDPPPLSFCFFQKTKAQCQYATGQDFGAPNQYSDLSLIYPRANADVPVLLAHLSWCCGFGCGGQFNYVWAYDPGSDAFKLIWSRPYDCHTALRFVTKGPLAGDMIAVDDDVTGHFPWPYGIELYQFTAPDRLTKLLYFAGRAEQGGKYVSGPNDAIDIDMPEILRRLGVAQ